MDPSEAGRQSRAARASVLARAAGGGHRLSGGRLRAAVLLTAVAATVLLASGCGGSADKMRRDYVALRYLEDAVAAVQARPVDRPAALRALRRALELAPQEPTISTTAPGLCVTLGLYSEGLDLLRAQDAPDRWLLAQCLLGTGRVEEGTRMLLDLAKGAQAADREAPGQSAVVAMQLNNAGYMLADAAVQLPTAHAMLKRATDTLPLDANCIDSLGWVHYRLGQFREAIFYLERAVRLQTGPRQPDLYYHLGAAYAAMGRHQRARAMLKVALKLDPHHPDTLQAMEKLRWLLPPLSLASAGTDSRWGAPCTGA